MCIMHESESDYDLKHVKLLYNNSISKWCFIIKIFVSANLLKRT